MSDTNERSETTEPRDEAAANSTSTDVSTGIDQVVIELASTDRNEHATVADGRGNAEGQGSDQSGDRLSQAIVLLRQHTDSGWEAIEDSVIRRTLALFRPSAPVRGQHELGDFFVASDVVVTHLRRRIDAVPQAAAQKIACTTGERDELEQVTIQLIAAYGAPLLDVAGQVHAAAMAVLQELLGALAPATEHVSTHVHIGDVSNDPLIVT